MRGQFEQVIVVLDRVGRSCSTLDAEYPIEQLVADFGTLAQLHFYDAPSGRWAVQNGCYNEGARIATADWLLFTHDDVIWPDHNYVSAIDEHLEAIIRFGGRSEERVVGLILPEWEVANQVAVPAFETTAPILTQVVSPVSQVLARSAFEEMGGFDETYGIWYDGQLEHETLLREWWYVSVPVPRLQHTSNRTYQVNNWGNAWAPNPKWGRHAENFARKYGVPPTSRRLDGKTLPLPW